MDEKLISIIVPVYKVENYIRESIESIINQPYDNLEILLIDDGSPDNSGKICDEYAEKDSRIKVIHKKNGGVSTARNCGIENSTGEYIMFLDSDDLFVENVFEEIIHDLKREADIYTYTYMQLDVEGNLIVNDLKKISNNIYGKDVLLKKYYKNYKSLPSGIWQNIFKANIIKENKILFEVGVKGAEDMDFFISYIKKCKNINFKNMPLIKYRTGREGSAMTNLKPELICDILKIYAKYSNDEDKFIAKVFSNFYISGLNYIIKSKSIETLNKVIPHIRIDIIKKSRRIKTIFLKILYKDYGLKKYIVIFTENK